MKLLALATFLVHLQVVLGASVERSGERTDILDRSKRDINDDWAKRLADAKKRTKLLEDLEKKAAKNGKVNDASKRLAQFLSSTRHITETGKSAKTQLDVIKSLLRDWRKKEIAEGRSGNPEDFWRAIRQQQATILKKQKKPKKSSSSGSSGKYGEPDICPFQPIECSESNKKYRTFDGSCNNLVYGRTQWGSKDRAQERLLPPDYADSVEAPRVASDGSDLPSARKVSNSLFEMKSNPSGINTVLLMTFGQFLDHDITHTPGATIYNEETGKNEPVFCGDDNCGIRGDAGKDCFSIPLSANDPLHKDGGCMYMARSEAYLDDDCSISQRQVANAITAWTDASQVYGSSKEECDSLREDDQYRGRMKMSKNPMDSSLKPMLPFADNKESSCSGVDETVHCFKAGDVRQNEQIGLTSMHTIMVRLHNYIEGQLYQHNPGWDGETLFQESRKLVIGIWQHIIYNEFLPVILGKNIMEKFKLDIESKKHFKGYDDKVRGDILTVFSTAAFRYGHTQIPNKMTYANHQYSPEDWKLLSEVLFNPRTLYHCPLKGMSGIDAVMHGMMCAKAEGYDRNFAEQIKQNLFTSKPPHGHGFDLPALNTQRGRDHGLKGYVAWRVFLGLDKYQSHWEFSDLTNIDKETRDKFRQIYKKPEDIDLFAAGVSEKSVRGGVVGPTFARIIALQFWKLKAGDRYYYENDHKYGFTENQLYEIKKFSLAKVLCYTLDSVEKIQPYVLLQAKDKVDSGFNWSDYGDVYDRFMRNNSQRPCGSFPDIDFSIFGDDNDSSSSGKSKRSHSSKSKGSHSSKSKGSHSSKSKGSKSSKHKGSHS